MNSTSVVSNSPTSADHGSVAHGHEQSSQSVASLWIRYLVRRIGSLIVSLFALMLLTFFIVQLIPGDPATAIAGDNATLQQVEQVRKELGLDRPVWDQFVDYVANALRGNFGTSFKYKIPAMQIVTTALPYTLVIAACAIALVLVFGVGIGIAVGVLTRGDRHRCLDTVFSATTGIIQSIPSYLQATLLVLFFAVWLAVLPPAYTLAYGFVESAVLPIVALSLGGIASIARIVRRECAVTQEADYMRTARGWRLPAIKLYIKHLLPNLLTTALTLSGIILTSMLGSALIVETVFSWPGLGTTVIQAIAVNKDYPVIQASVFVIGGISQIFTLAIDIVLGIVDPRTLGGNND